MVLLIVPALLDNASVLLCPGAAPAEVLASTLTLAECRAALEGFAGDGPSGLVPLALVESDGAPDHPGSRPLVQPRNLLLIPYHRY